MSGKRATSGRSAGAAGHSGAARRICLGAFAGAHGVKGEARVKAFTARPQDVAAYGPLTSEDGRRRFTLSVVRLIKDDIVLVRAPEIASREEAMALAGMRLYAPRSALPAPADEDEFYLEDLVGLEARDASGARIGVVTGVFDFGAGDILEVARDANGSFFSPFTRAAAPRVDLAAGFIEIVAESGAEATSPAADAAFIDEAMRQSDA